MSLILSWNPCLFFLKWQIIISICVVVGVQWRIKNGTFPRVWRSSSYTFENCLLGLAGCTCLVENSSGIKLNTIFAFMLHSPSVTFSTWQVCHQMLCYLLCGLNLLKVLDFRIARIKIKTKSQSRSKLSQSIFVLFLSSEHTAHYVLLIAISTLFPPRQLWSCHLL